MSTQKGHLFLVSDKFGMSRHQMDYAELEHYLKCRGMGHHLEMLTQFSSAKSHDVEVIRLCGVRHHCED